MIEKACPVVLHPDGAPLRLLAFTHPHAGDQLVKGSVRDGEAPAYAAARELFEEAGVETRSALLMGSSDDIMKGERWHFALCRAKPPLRERWQHFCADDDGHLFTFFWFSPDAPPVFEARYIRALDWIRTRL